MSTIAAFPPDLDSAFFADLSTRSHGRDLRLLLSLIARYSLWVDPAVAAAVPVPYPKTARVVAGRGRPGSVVAGVRYFTNQPAIHAFFMALGSHERWFSGEDVCHIHGDGVHDPRHFTRLANLIALPSTLARFSDAPLVDAALKYRAFELYGYRGPHRSPPQRPAGYPHGWARPTSPDDFARTVARLEHARLENPMYSRPRGPAAAPTIMPKHAPPRDLDAQFWRQALAAKAPVEAFVRWVVRFSYFAPPAVVKAVPVPYPLCRRVVQNTDERPGQFRGGAWLVNNTPAARVLMVAMGLPQAGAVVGGTVDHAWDQAAYLAGHYAHLAGLVLVPLAMASLVDAPPIRGLLQRHIFERTGYRGPIGKVPAPSPLTPAAWPERVRLSGADQLRAITKLRKYREKRPGFYPKSAPQP